jgi:RNA polymerase sigma-70 factor (ECF subfamily)
MDFLQPHKHINDWARRFAEGDEKGAEKLFDYFYPLVFRYIRSRIKDADTAEDLTQEVFLKLAKGIRMYNKEKGHFSAWLWQIVRNVFTDHLRSVGRNHEDAASSREIDPDTFAAIQTFDDDAELTRVFETIATYSPEDQEIFRMRYIAGLSYEHIAEITDRTINAVTVAAHRVREKIKKDITSSFDKKL